MTEDVKFSAKAGRIVSTVGLAVVVLVQRGAVTTARFRTAEESNPVCFCHTCVASGDLPAVVPLATAASPLLPLVFAAYQ